MHALGHPEDIRDVEKFIQIKETYQPVSESHDVYHEIFAIYERSYRCFKQEFDAIADLQRRLAERKDAR